MKFSFRIRLSVYRLLIKRGLTVEKMRAKDFRSANFSGASFYRASFSGASFYRANFSDASFSGASFSGASLNLVGLGVQLQIGRYRASFVGKYLSVGCVTRTVKTFAKGSAKDYAQHEEGARYKEAIQKTVKAVFALRRAARVRNV